MHHGLFGPVNDRARRQPANGVRACWQPDGVAAGLLLSIHGDSLDLEKLRARAAAEDVIDTLAALRTVLGEGKPLTEDRLSKVHDTLENP